MNLLSGLTPGADGSVAPLFARHYGSRLKEGLTVTAEEIKVIEFKIDVVKQCQERIGSNQYYHGLLDAYNEILQELGGINDAKTTR
jgi:hypothetical protein